MHMGNSSAELLHLSAHMHWNLNGISMLNEHKLDHQEASLTNL